MGMLNWEECRISFLALGLLKLLDVNLVGFSCVLKYFMLPLLLSLGERCHLLPQRQKDEA